MSTPSAAVAAARPTPAPTAPEPRTGTLDRFTWAVAIGAIILVLVGIVVAAFVGRGQAPPDLSTPQGVTLAYELALRRGEADVAWDLLSSAAQGATTRQEFLARAATYQPGQDARFNVENVRESGDTAYLDLVWTTPSGGFLGLGAGVYSSRHPVTLQREQGQWRISVPAEPYLVMAPPMGARP